MADNAEINAAVHQVSHVIQKLVGVHRNVPQVEKDTVVHNIVMLSHMVKIANLNAFVVRMHLTAMYEAESASANQDGLEINVIKSAPRVNMVIIARKNVSAPMENALMTQVCDDFPSLQKIIHNQINCYRKMRVFRWIYWCDMRAQMRRRSMG